MSCDSVQCVISESKIIVTVQAVVQGVSQSSSAVDSVFGRIGAVVAEDGDYTADQVGLGNVDNTSDADKPVSDDTQTALDLKASKSNVLELDNTTEFTPTTNYHPATKIYVDENSGGLTVTIGVTDSSADFECDGTNDEVIFANALDTMSDGETLTVLAGTYTFSAVLTVDKSITIIGVDLDKTIITMIDKGEFSLFNCTSRVIIKGIKFTVQDYQSAVSTVPLVIISGEYSKVENCYFYAVSGYYCIKLNANNLMINDNRFWANSQSTAVFWNFSQKTTMTKNIIDGFIGIKIGNQGGMEKSIIIDNRINCYTGIDISTYTNKYVQISSNCLNCIITAIKMDCTHSTAVLSHIMIQSNLILGYNTTTTTAISVNGVTDCQIINNTIINAMGIVLNNGSGGQATVRTFLAGNSMSDDTIAGITETGLTDYTKIGFNSNMGTVTIIGSNSVNKDI